MANVLFCFHDLSAYLAIPCYTQICLQEKVKQSNSNPRVLLPMKSMEGTPGAKATKIVGFGVWKNKVWNWNIRVNLQAAHLSDLVESYILWL